jgi:hypothetical protein
MSDVDRPDDELLVLLAAAQDPPAGVRADVLATALARRDAHRPVDAVAPCSPAAAYRRAADDLRSLLDSLPRSAWDAFAHADYGPVRALVAHLAGVEELTLGWLGARPLDDRLATTNHRDATRAAVEALGGLEPAELVDRWHAGTIEVEAAARTADPALPIMAHDLPTDPDGLLVLRAFELFAHTHDVAAAAARPVPAVDPAQLALMSQRLVEGLPFALASRGTTLPGRTARLVLTGDTATGRAGGVYDVALDPSTDAGAPEVTIIVDVTAVCLLAARRHTPATVGAVVDGDAALADAVLAGAGAFARD